MDARPGRGAAGPGAVRGAAGPLALEALLLEDLERERLRLREDPRALARPLAIVVPSHSLRLHLAAVCVRASGGALLGVRVATLHELALEVLERAGRPVPRGSSLFAALVRRRAADEPALEK